MQAISRITIFLSTLNPGYNEYYVRYLTLRTPERQSLPQATSSSAGAVLFAGAAVVLAWCLCIRTDVDQSGLVAVRLGDTGNLTSRTGGDSLDIHLAGAFLALEGSY